MILKLKRTPGLFLVGFMGVGKTTVGPLVADALGWSFADLDDDIVAQQHKTIPQLFVERGEPEFRRIEYEMILHHVRLIQRGRPTVLALGGGAFAQSKNHKLLEENGVTVWLECPLEVVRERIGDDPNRPLARDPQAMSELFELRREVYARADFRVDAAGDPKSVCRAILDLQIF